MSEIIREIFDRDKWIVAITTGLIVTVGVAQLIGSSLFETPIVTNTLLEAAKIGGGAALATRVGLAFVENVFRSDKNHLPPPTK